MALMDDGCVYGRTFADSFTITVLEQIEDRIHRASNMHQVTIWTLVTVGTIEQLVAQTINKRYHTTRFSMDGRRGVDIERKVLSKIRIKMSDPDDRVNSLEGDENGKNSIT